MPNAWVNPGVKIGSDVVIAARSLVNRDIPSGSLAGGVPVKVLRSGAYPRELDAAEKRRVFSSIFEQAMRIAGSAQSFDAESPDRYRVNGECLFDLKQRMIEGKATAFTEMLKNQLRRNGIRFRYLAVRGEYRPWENYAF
jgi:hypothetical protein